MTDISKDVAYCGLICPLDSCFENCGGCRNGKGCGDKDCFHKICCNKKSIKGCWECNEFPCNEGYFKEENKSSGQFIGCVRYIKEEGLLNYIEAVKVNSNQGIRYGLGGDYGNKQEETVIKLLKNCKKD
jgi:hypothetical protein